MRLESEEVPIFSKTAVHTLKALAFLASLEEGQFADARAVAAAAEAPPNYLGKLLGQLARAGIVEGKKGSGGGFRLARPAAELSLEEALAPVEQLPTERDCILGNDSCDGHSPCALHGRWATIRFETLEFLRSTHLDAIGGHETDPILPLRMSKEAS